MARVCLEGGIDLQMELELCNGDEFEQLTVSQQLRILAGRRDGGMAGQSGRKEDNLRRAAGWC